MLRDQFAMNAFGAITEGHFFINEQLDNKWISETSYELADEMLEARKAK